MSLELARYLFVGIGSNVINFIVYLLCYSIGISLFVSSAAGYSAGLIVSYHFGRIWVFGRKFDMSKRNVVRFTAVYVVGGLGMSALIELLEKTMGIDYRVSWLFGAGFAAVNNFLGLKWFVFNKSEASNGN